jgi:hypothetical protein
MNYSEVFWGVTSAFLAFLLGLAWRRLAQLVVNYRARRFWRPLTSDHMSVVLGRFRGLPGFEASGVVGAGDNIALKDLSDYFARIGFKRFTVFYNDQFGWTDTTRVAPLRGNLILLGGPDANTLTRDVLERLPLGIEFLEVEADRLEQFRHGSVTSNSVPARPRGWTRLVRWGRARTGRDWRVPVILDLAGDKVHAPVLDGDVIRSDCGVLIRCPNPFNKHKEVMIFCGSYGYGTWAAVQFAQTREFLERVPRNTRAIECILSVDVVREMPQAIRVELLRPVADSHRTPDAPVIVPRILE